jgi:hypothetical protein
VQIGQTGFDVFCQFERSLCREKVTDPLDISSAHGSNRKEGKKRQWFTMKARVVSSSPSTKYFPLCIQRRTIRGIDFVFLFGHKGAQVRELHWEEKHSYWPPNGVTTNKNHYFM